MAKKDKRSTQISIPLNVTEKELKDHVKQHWNITFSRQGKISVVGKRMMTMVLAQIQDNDMNFKPYYEMHVSDVVKSSDGGSAYNHCKQAFQELASVAWMIEDEKEEYFAPRHLLDTTKHKKKDGFETAYNKGQITLALNPVLEPYFLQIAHYSKYELSHYMKFKSWYSMRLWEILSAFKDTGKWFVDLDEYRILMDCDDKYKDVNLLIKKTLSEPLEELKETELAFEYEKVFAKYSGKGRPPVIGLNFYLIKAAKSDMDTLKEWGKHTERHGRLINEALNTWKITPKHLVKYLPILKIDPFAELLRTFQLKQTSSRRMDNIAKYCNAAFLKAAKEAQKE